MEKFGFLNRPHYRLLPVLFLVTLIFYTLTTKRIYKDIGGGDEPHYLITAHSLLYDGDVNLINNYQEKEFVHLSPPHYGYTAHSIGLPLLIAPFYYLKGRLGALFFMNIMAALYGISIYLLIYQIFQDRKTAVVSWVIISFSLPLLLIAFHVYPDLIAGIITAHALRKTYYHSEKQSYSWFWLSLLVSFYPWLHFKYVVLTIVFSALFLYMYRRDKKVLLLFFSPMAFSFSLLTLYHYYIFGNPFYEKSAQIFSSILVGIPGQFLDQQFGLFIYSPVYIFLPMGIALIFKARRGEFFWLSLLFLSLYLPNSAYRQWYGGWSPAGRFLLPLMPILLILLSNAFITLRSLSFRVLFFLLVLIGVINGQLLIKYPYLIYHHTPQMGGLCIDYFGKGELLKKFGLEHYFPCFTIITAETFRWSIFWGLIIFFINIFYYRFYYQDRMEKRGRFLIRYAVFSIMVLGTLWPLTGMIYGKKPAISKIIYEAEDLKYQPGHIVADDKASGKHARHLVPIPGKNLLLKFGPYKELPEDKYEVQFFMRTLAETHPHLPVVTLKITANLGKSILNKKELTGVQLAQSDHYPAIPMNFRAFPGLEDFEFFIYFADNSEFWVDRVEIIPLKKRKITRLEYEAEELLSITGMNITDARAWNGKARYAHIGRDKPGILVYGPYESLPDGTYKVEFWLRCQPVPTDKPDKKVAIIDIAANVGRKILVKKALVSKDFLVTQDYQKFPLIFEVSDKTSDLEFRIHFLAQGDLWADRITLKASP
jgi:hypothetical protein